MNARARRGLFLLATLVAFSNAAVALAAAPTGKPSVVADSGYSSARDGYAFPNYGNAPGRPNLGSDEMRQLFGDVVCAGFTGGTCVLSPPALAWMQQQNTAMANGHCFGFSVTTLLFWAGLSNPSQFGASKVPKLKLSANQLLAREIAYGYVFQLLQSVISGEVSTSPSAVLSTLMSGLRRSGPLYTLGLVSANGAGGHAVTPYAVERLSPDHYAILVYDNNFPGATRRVLVNTKTNSWSYEAALNPSVPASLYTGNASTQGMLLMPARPGLGVQACPFCAPPSAPTPSAPTPSSPTPSAAADQAGDAPLESVRLQGSGTDSAHLVVVGPGRRRIGFVHNHLVNTIPGARIVRVFVGETHTWRDRIEPQYEVPTGPGYRIELTSGAGGRHRRSNSEQSVTVLEPGFLAAARGIAMTGGKHALVNLINGGHGISFLRPRGAREPLLVLGNAEPGANDYQWNIDNLSRSPGTPIIASLDVVNRIMSLTGAGTYDLTMHLVHNGVETFTFRHFTLGPGETATFDYANWGPGEPMPVTIYRNGVAISMQLLNNQPTSDAGGGFFPVEPTLPPAEPQPTPVAPGTTGTTLTCRPVSIAPRQSVKCKVEVGNLDSVATGTPTGEVQFSTNGAGSFSPATCTLTAGECEVTFTLSAPPPGPLTLTADYLGSGLYQSSMVTFSPSTDTITLQVA